MDTYKYLGVWISKQRNFRKAISYLGNQEKKVICALKQCLYKLKSPPVPVPLQLFNSIVKPVLCYGCEIGGFTKHKEIERSEMHYLKYILHLPKSATNVAVCGELGQFPIHLYWKESIFKYWCRVNTEEVPLHVKQAVLVQSTMLNDGKSCWLSKSQQIYNEAGLSFKFSMAGTEFTRQHVNEVMTQLSDQFVQDWYVQVSRPGGEGRRI